MDLKRNTCVLPVLFLTHPHGRNEQREWYMGHGGIHDMLVKIIKITGGKNK